MIVTPQQSNAGDVITAAAINNPVNQIAAVINGGLDSTNITPGSITAASLAPSLASAVAGGYTALSAAPSTVTYSGNRSYQMVFNNVDLTGTLSPGMRLRTTRTVAAPTQSTALNGTTQFWSRTSPTGVISTAFTCMGWIKLSAYPSGGQGGSIISQTDTTTGGYMLRINTSGQVSIYYAGSSNFSEWFSYQSVPLNKWVHVAAVVSSISGKTLQGIYIDGVLVPNSNNTLVATTLVQTGALSVGAANTGVAGSFFPGKIAQAAVFSAVLSQSTIQSYISQGLAGTEPNLVSAYSFNGSMNDLTTNANNLTANGSVTATAADSPFGGQASGLISSTLDYGIVQATAFSTNTTVTVQVPEGCTIPTSGGVSAVVYSSNKVPYGFPADMGKWSICSILKTNATQNTPSAGTWYNLNSYQLAIPSGYWRIGYEVTLFSPGGAAASGTVFSTLSNSASSESDNELMARTTNAVSNQGILTTVGRTKRNSFSLALTTPYYLLAKHDQAGAASINFWTTDSGTAIIYADLSLL